jgi:hypothetical protein
MNMARHDPTGVAIAVMSAFGSATQATATVAECGPGGAQPSTLVARAIELRDECSLLRGGFDTFVANVLSMPFDSKGPTGSFVMVIAPAFLNYRRLSSDLMTRCKTVQVSALRLAATAGPVPVAPSPPYAQEIMGECWLLLQQIHEYNLDVFLNRSAALLSKVLEFVSSVTAHFVALFEEF